MGRYLRPLSCDLRQLNANGRKNWLSSSSFEYGQIGHAKSGEENENRGEEKIDQLDCKLSWREG